MSFACPYTDTSNILIVLQKTITGYKLSPKIICDQKLQILKHFVNNSEHHKTLDLYQHKNTTTGLTKNVSRHELIIPEPVAT